jgi:adenylate cyclase
VATPTRATRLYSFLIAAAIVLLVGALYMVAPPLLRRAELELYDQHFRLRRSRPGNDRVVIVAIDEASLREVGRWPWSRAVLAELVARLDQAGAAAIAFDIILNEPEVSSEQHALARIAARLKSLGVGRTVEREIEAVAREADPDRQFAGEIRKAGRVILPVQVTLMPDAPREPPARVGQPMKSALGSFKNYAERGLFAPPSAQAEGFPIPPLLDAAAGVGHVHMVADVDGSTRWEALVIESRGHYYPSLALETVRIAAGLDPFSLRVEFGHTVQLGEVSIPIDARARVLVDYAGPPRTFRHFTAADLLRGKVPAERLRDRIVFVGATAEGTYDLRVTPFSGVFPGVEKHANVAANILDRRFIIRPAWVELVEAAGIVIFPILLAWILPRLRPVTSLGAALAIWLAFYGGTHLVFRRGLWLPVIYPSLALALTWVVVTVYRFLTEERQRLFTKRAFQQYVSPEVVERIVEDPAALQFGGEVRELTVLFSDIRDFTTFTEKHDPQEVVQMLREYLTRMTDQVLKQQGTLDKYIGDAVMAIFGAPIALPDHAERACRAALAMAAELERLQAKWVAEGKEPFRIGIGINTGKMVVGNLGSEQLFDYTVIGDEVNLGARLESLNKEYKTGKCIILSEGTYEAAREAIEVRRLGEVTVKGKTRPVVVYELLGLTTP